MKRPLPACLIVLSLPAIAIAQDGARVPYASPPYSLSAVDLRMYCVHADRIYSEGSMICTANNTMQLCNAADTDSAKRRLTAYWTATTDARCAGNVSMTPQ